MASKKVTAKIQPPQPVEPDIVLTLDSDSARHLRTILYSGVGGSGEARETSDTVEQALSSAGVLSNGKH